MRDVIKIPVRGVRSDEEVGPIFKSNGEDYMKFSLEFPKNLFKKNVPAEDFYLFVTDEKTKSDEEKIKSGEFVPPSIEQTLWVIAFASCPFMKVVSEGPVQFLHEPFPFQGGKKGQIRISHKRDGNFYFVEVVPADETPSPGTFIALGTNYGAR